MATRRHDPAYTMPTAREVLRAAVLALAMIAALAIVLPALGATTYTDNGDGTVTVEGGVAGLTISVSGDKALADQLIAALAHAVNYQATVACVEGATLRDADRILVAAGSDEYACTPGEEMANPQPDYDAALIRVKQGVERDASAFARWAAEQALPDTDVDLDAGPPLASAPDKPTQVKRVDRRGGR